MKQNILVIFLCAQSFGSILFAMPSGEQVVSGSASFDRSAGHGLSIIASDKAIIDYNSFSIGNLETVRFIQPGASSVALNRVTGPGISEILGSLKANGNIFLINPAGILFGANSQVNVGGLVASTLDISNEDFLAGRYQLAQAGANPSSVVNNGTISAQSVALIGGAVANNGLIEAMLGRVSLASGSKATVSFDADGMINVTVSDEVAKVAKYADGTSAADAAANAGVIEANGGSVLMTAKTAEGIFARAVNNTGIIRATAVTGQGGSVRLLAEGRRTIAVSTGIIDVTGNLIGQHGGVVQVLGDYVGVQGGTIDASGNAGGGTVLIGGDYQGKGSVPNASRTYVGPQAQIRADAITNGNGGKIIVWSDISTRAEGSLSVRGGQQGGDGGLIETSSGGHLDLSGLSVDASAPKGSAGLWFIDPNNITIGASADNNMDETGDPWFSTDDSAVVNTTTLLNALALANVTIQTRSNGGNSQDGDITVSGFDYNTMSATRTLTLQADDDIVVNGAITDSVPGGETLNLILTSNRQGAGATGLVDINAAISCSSVTITNGGALTITAAGDMNLTGAFTQNGAGAVTTAGDITTTNNNILFMQAVTLSGPVALSTQGGGAGIGDITFLGTLNGAQTLNLTAGTGNIAFAGIVGGGQPLSGLTVNSAAATTFNAAATFAGPVVITSGNVNFNFPFTTTTGGTLTVTNLGTLSTLAAADMNLDGAFIQNGAGPNSLAGDITTTNDNILFTTAVTLSGPVALSTQGGGAGIGDITFLGALNGAQALTLTAGTGNIAFADVTGGLIAPTALTVNSAAAITFNAASTYAGPVAITGGNVNFNFPFTTTGGGTLTVTNNVIAGNSTLSTLGAGDLNLDGAFLQNGVGANLLAGDITTNNAAITFNTAVRLTGNVAMSTGAGAGTITFGSTLDATTAGTETLGLTAGTGNITMTGAVGAITRLGTLTVNSVADWNTASTISASSIVQTSGSGTTTFNDSVDTDTVGGISLTGTNFFLAYVHAGSGAITVNANAGGIIDNNGDANNLNAALDSFLTAKGSRGVIGTRSDPLDVQIGGTLTVCAEGQLDGVSVNINGNVSGSRLTLGCISPGLILFNYRRQGGSSDLEASIDEGLGSLFNENNFLQYDYGSAIIHALINGAIVDEETLSKPPKEIDGSEIGLNYYERK